VIRTMLCLLVMGSMAWAATTPQPKINVQTVLNDFHDAASKADRKRYFGHFAKDAIFLGTDPGERWTVKEFDKYVRPYFKKGKGWTYHPRNRHIYYSDDKKTAWFDEELFNMSYGTCRGTGALRIEDGKWKIAQYNLTIPIPNSLAKEVVKMIREEKKIN